MRHFTCRFIWGPQTHTRLWPRPNSHCAVLGADSAAVPQLLCWCASHLAMRAGLEDAGRAAGHRAHSRACTRRCRLCRSHCGAGRARRRRCARLALQHGRRCGLHGHESPFRALDQPFWRVTLKRAAAAFDAAPKRVRRRCSTQLPPQCVRQSGMCRIRELLEAETRLICSAHLTLAATTGAL